MGELKFYPLEISYKVVKDRPVVHLYGRTEANERVCVADAGFGPYLWVVLKTKAEEERFLSLEIPGKIERKMLLGSEVSAVKVLARLPEEIPKMKEDLRGKKLDCHEADILFVRRYLIDKGIVPGALCTAVGEYGGRSKVKVFGAERVFASGSFLDEPSMIAFDIETYSPFGRAMAPEEQPILMISLFGMGVRKVLAWKECRNDYVEFVSDEAALLRRFKEIIDDKKPEILVGYNSDGFDLPYIRTRAERLKVPLDIGLDFSPPRFAKGSISAAEIRGIVHLDIFKFVRNVIGRTKDLASLSLNNVAKEFLGENKHSVDISRLPEVWESGSDELASFCEYCLKDAELTLRLAEKLLPSINEFVRITGLQISDVTRMSLSQIVEWYLLKEAGNFGQISPNRPSGEQLRLRQRQTYSGGFVYEPKPGLYNDMVVFDFRSLYPSIISAHNISPDTLNCSCCADAEKVPGEQFWFCRRKKGFVSSLIEDVIIRRVAVKEEQKKSGDRILAARAEALKLVANSMYGYLGFFGARWYSLECARAITAYGRYHIQQVIKKAKEEMFNVLYSDSLPYDRFLFVKFNDEIRLIKIGELYDKFRDFGMSTLAFYNGKVVFRPITRVIRHEYNGKLLKFVTKYGTTITTPQHSVFSYDKKTGKEYTVDAKKLKVGDKLISLTNPETFVKHYDGHIFDLVDLDFGDYAGELLLYSDSLAFPAKRGICPYCSKEYNLAGHVNSSHPERRHEFKKISLFGLVGGKNGKTRKIPRYWALDEDLAWLLGYYAAEGSVSDVHTKTGRKCLLSFGSQDRNIIEKVKGILDAKTGMPASIIEDFDPRINKKMYYFRVQCLPVVALFQNAFGCGKGSSFKKVPLFIFTSEEKLREAYIRGYLEGDGNKARDMRYKTHFTRFCTNSKELAMGLAYLLKASKHLFHARGKEIKHVSWNYRADKPKVNNLRLQSAKESMENFCFAEIKSIEETESEGFVYDLEVEGSRNFVDAEGMILVHNTDSIFLALDGKSKSSAELFAESINAGLPGLMELDYEGFYPSGIFVPAKESGFGAKKKYALLSEGGLIKIRGFEAVRRNLSPIAKEVQEKVLTIILKEKDIGRALAYVQEVISDLRSKKVSLEKVVIATQLTKEIIGYESVGPHVAVAQRMRNAGMQAVPGAMIRYVVTEGKQRIRERARMPEEVKEGAYDADYYVTHQVLPVVEKIFEVLGYNAEDLDEKKQSRLDRFF